MSKVTELKNKTFELRPLRGDDVFAVFEIVDKLDLIEPLSDLMRGKLRESIIEAAQKDDKAEADTKQVSDTAVGLDIVLQLAKVGVRNVPKARVEINELLGDLTGTDARAVGNLPIKDYMGLVTDFFKHDDLQELLQSVMQLSESE